VEIRKKINSKCEFLLEAGFIAETIQNQSGFTSEAVIDTETSRGNSVFITVQVDQRDPVDLNTIPDKDLLNTSREELYKDNLKSLNFRFSFYLIRYMLQVSLIINVLPDI